MTAIYRKTGYAPKTVYDSENNRYVTSLILLETTANYAIKGEGIGYTTLSDAVTSAKDGDTIIALRNYSDSSQTNIDKNLILNLNEITTTKFTSSIIVEEGKAFTIRGNGTLKSSSSIHTITNNGTVNIETANDGTLSNTSSNYSVIYNIGNINIKPLYNLKINGSTYGLYNENTGNINISENSTDFSITITATTYGIYNNSSGDINISGNSGKCSVTITATTYGIYNNSSGNINILDNSSKSNISITASTGIYNKLEEGIVSIDDATINVTSRGIDIQSGTLLMTGGNINTSGSAKGIYCTTGNVTISADIQFEDYQSDHTTAIYNENGTVVINSGAYLEGSYYGIYNESGNVTINGGSIQNNYYNTSTPLSAIYNDSGTIQINNVTIYAYGYGIYNDSGTVNILKGKINGCRRNAIQNYGSLTIGNKSGQYTANEVTIESHYSYGLYTTQEVDIYTGVIIRGTNSTPYSSSRVNFPSGYTASTKQGIADCIWNDTGHDGMSIYETTLSPIVSTTALMAFPLEVLSLFSNT